MQVRAAGCWLLAAIVCDLLTYATAVERLTGGIALWIALDLWLAHRIWKGGAVALAAFRLLEGFGLLLSAWP